MRYKAITFVILGLFLFSLVSALDVTLTPNIITDNVKQGESITKTIHYEIFNPDTTTQTATIIINTDILPFTTTSISSVVVDTNETETGDFTITFSPSISDEDKLYADYIRLGSENILAKITVEEDQTGTCRLIELPHTTSFRITQGETGTTQQIKIRASTECPDLIFNSLAPQTQMDKPMYIESMGESEQGREYIFTVGLDAVDVQTGTYSNSYIVSAFSGDTIYSKTIPLSVTVSSGTAPDSTFTTLPTCSLSASEFALNQTYKLICNSISPNIEVQPVIDYDYIKGIGVSETGDSYEYSFQPIQFGNTEIKARFLFKNAPMGSEYSQEVRILASSGVVQGTSLALKFYPDLYEAKEDEPITIRAVDNESGNILTNAKIYLDGIEMLNDSLVLKSNKNYEIRASFIGYRDLVETINLNPKLINFTIGTEYNLGDSLNFTTDPEDATVTLNGSLISLPFPLNSIGTFEISVSKLGYTTSTQNITVGSHSKIIYSTPIDSIEKGGEILVEFAENETLIYVDFQADPSEAAVILVQEFTGKQVSFLTEKEGVYHVYADGEFIQQFSVIKSDGWWNFYKSPWVWIPAIIILILLFIYYGFFAPDPEDEEDN